MRSIIFQKKLLIFILLSIAVTAQSQTLSGYVFTQNGKGDKAPVEGANVFFQGSGNGTTTASDGLFTIKKETNGSSCLIATFGGYSSDTLLISNNNKSPIEFVLKESIELSEAVVTANQRGTYMSKLTPQKTELITKSGLAKMACCNLSESFENSATVTVGFTDAVSGAKQVQLLGLSGIYSQMLAENIPIMRGLASTYGWSYTPGTWLESIQISKGASSVVNGYESITGQINLEMEKPNNTDPLFINLYADHAGRYEANVTAATKVAKDLWTSLLLHGSTESQAHDGNDDGFLDQPKSKLVNVYNRWFYLSENGIQSRTGIKFLYETREGGQHMDDMGSGDSMNEPHYETNIENRNFTVENKTGFPVGDKEGQTIGIINSFTHHEQHSEFGKKTYGGDQNLFYSNVLFTSSIGEDNSHRYTVGASFSYDDYKTQFEDLLKPEDSDPVNTVLTDLNKNEVIPGAFAEYTYSFLEKFTFIAGFRGDHNSKYGWLFTPRTNLKYSITDDIIVRASAGRGYRSPLIIAENIGLMGSSRKFHVEDIEKLDIESAWNYGGNLAFSIPVWDERKISLSLDYFHTEFENQAIVDTERDRNSVFFYNLQGRSYADVWQIDLSVEPFKGFDICTAFRYNNTQITYTDVDGTTYQKEKPLSSRYRGLVNLSYATNFKRWVFDVTAQINGPSRIPGLNGYESQIRESPVFPIYFAQVTKNSKRFDIYLGVENILDYRQPNPIVNYDLPFSKDFDSSLIWGPLMGRKIYIGTRIRIGDLK